MRTPIVTQDPAQWQQHRMATWCAAALLVFLILFPKGGLSSGGVPLTWGYFLLAFCTFLSLPRAFLTIFSQPLSTWGMLALTVPLQIAVVYSAISYPITEKGFAISELSTFVFLPYIVLILFGPFWEICDRDLLLRVIRGCIFWAAVIGLFLFMWRIKMGYFIEIPYLTVNASDIGLTGTIKENGRGGIFKLISTYANGNIYGVCTLMLLPLFDCLEGKRHWRKIVVRIAIALTLSRTVWLCLVLSQIIKPIGDSLSAFPRFRLSLRSGYQLLLVIPVIGLVLLGLWAMNADVSFIFDSSFGGRAPQLSAAASNISFFPPLPLEGIAEVVYASVLTELGVLGLIGMFLLLFGPLIISLFNHSIWHDPLRRSALLGQLIYGLAAGMDGAIQYIPVMAMWWILTLIILHDPKTASTSEEIPVAAAQGVLEPA
jgi:hypothetical protein